MPFVLSFLVARQRRFIVRHRGFDALARHLAACAVPYGIARRRGIDILARVLAVRAVRCFIRHVRASGLARPLALRVVRFLVRHGEGASHGCEKRLEERAMC